VIATQAAPELQPITEAAHEPLADQACEPASELQAIEAVVEHPSEPSEDAGSVGIPATRPDPADEPIAEAVTEPGPSPVSEELSAAEPKEQNLPAEQHIEPVTEAVPVTEAATEPASVPGEAQISDPEHDAAHAEELPSEPAAEPLPERHVVVEVQVAAESQSEPPAVIAAIAELEIEPIAELATKAENVPAAEPLASPEPTAEIQAPPPAETTSAPETAAPVIAAPVLDEKAAARLAARQKRLDEADEQSPFSVIVDQVYDGPLDLLLDLIRKQDIDIYDIPIAKITSQFLAYVNQLKASDVDVAGEFIYTASLLIHIKSKMLLPRAPAGPDDTPEDPRRELVERLLEHERFKNAAQMLQQKQLLEAASWTNPGAQEFKDDESVEPEIAADTVDLVRIFRDILERARTRPVIDVSEDQVTVGQMIQFLARRLTMEDKPVALRRLLAHTRSERALIAMFLALLELVRLQAVLLRQDRAFSEIFIKKHTGFDSVMNEGLVNARDDWK
jgi:segregation and condensation protein A